jgi:glucose/arabinose dehydrogenase
LQAATAIRLTPLIDGLDRPVQIVSSHEHTGDLFIVELPGRILTLRGTELLDQPFLDIRSRVSCCDNGGLLSVAFHPNYALNGFVYVLYVNLDGDTELVRFTRGDPASARRLFLIEQPEDNIPNHHGGTLLFGAGGFLFVSIGDGGAFRHVTNRAQETHHLLGKLLRLDVDSATPYAIPADNPFAGVPGARGEIWSLGLRNPWRFSFDRETGELLLGDVGQDAWEELNVLSPEAARGANFGWPMMEGAHCFPPGATCNSAGLTMPALEYPRAEGCSVTGGYRYRGRRFRQLEGIYFYGDWCSGRLWGARGSSSELLADTELAIVSFGEDDDGELYVVDFNGAVLRLEGVAMKRRAVRK